MHTLFNLLKGQRLGIFVVCSPGRYQCEVQQEGLHLLAYPLTARELLAATVTQRPEKEIYILYIQHRDRQVFEDQTHIHALVCTHMLGERMSTIAPT